MVLCFIVITLNLGIFFKDVDINLKIFGTCYLINSITTFYSNKLILLQSSFVSYFLCLQLGMSAAAFTSDERIFLNSSDGLPVN